MRRMKDMEAIGGSPMMGMGGLPDTFNLVINANNKLINKIPEMDDEKKEDELIRQVYDLARLSKNLLKGKELDDFVKRSVKMVE
jgi:molecular chaperone HtpG